jgi:hypothetical protein
MTVFHGTTASAAQTIEREGFRDGQGSYMLVGTVVEGVFVSDRPLDENEGACSEVVFAIDLDEVAIQDYEWIQEGLGYREWCVPASILNGFLRRRLTENKEA